VLTRRLPPTLLAAPALAQSDQRPVIKIAVREIVTSNLLEMLAEQSNVGTRIFRNYVEPLVDTDLPHRSLNPMARQRDADPAPDLRGRGSLA
jgi:hypothetical protein